MTVQRSTKQRNAVRTALSRTTDFRSAQDLHADILDAGGSIALATVYRNLTLLAEAGEIDHLVSEDGESRYRDCTAGHHHHLVCRGCGTTVEVEGQDVEEWAEAVGTRNGFSAISHTVELSGLCAACTGPGD